LQAGNEGKMKGETEKLVLNIEGKYLTFSLGNKGCGIENTPTSESEIKTDIIPGMANMGELVKVLSDIGELLTNKYTLNEPNK
jgi:hypothetical protein